MAAGCCHHPRSDSAARGQLPHAAHPQAQALQVDPIIVLLAVIDCGQLGGLAGVVLAVPTLAVPALAVTRVFFDFFRTRLQTKR